MKRLFTVFFMAVFAMFTSLSGAYAQQSTTGWTLNIDANKPNPVTAGTLVSIAAKVDNSSNNKLPKTTVEFIIPKSNVFVGATGFDRCTPNSASEAPLAEDLTVICDVPELLPYAETSGTIQIKPQENGVVDFAGIVKGNGFDEAITLTVVEGADLALELKLAETTVSAGSTTKFTAEITNKGPHSSKESVLTFAVPAGLKFSKLPNGCKITQGNEVKCHVAEIGVSQTIPLEFTAQVTTGNKSDIAIAPKITGSNPLDPDETNNQATAIINIIKGTDVSLRKDLSPSSPLLTGQDVEFTLTPQLAGYEPTSAQIVDELPVNYDNVSLSSVIPAASGWKCNVDGRKVTCDYAAVDGSKYETPIVIKAKAAQVSGNQRVINEATISSPDELDTNHHNNTATDGGADIVDPITDLKAHKSGPPNGLLVVGKTYEYELYASNEGNATFSDVITITDFLPVGMRVTQANGTGWSCPVLPVEGPDALICTNSSPLEKGASTSKLKLTVEITEKASTVAGEMANTMEVSFPNWRDIEPKDRQENNTDTFGGTAGEPSTNVPSIADLAVKKSIIASDVITAGDEVEFQIKVYNNGPAKATGVVVSDRLENIVGSKEGGSFANITPVTQIPGAKCTIVDCH